MKETTEFVDALTNTAAQGVVSFADGAQLSDAADFLDEALSFDKAIKGLNEGFPREAKTVTSEQVEQLFEPQREKLVSAGLNPLLVGSIVSGVKGVYYTYAAILQSQQPLVVARATA